MRYASAARGLRILLLSAIAVLHPLLEVCGFVLRYRGPTSLMASSKDTCDNVLLRAFRSILSESDFDIPSQPAIAARKSATCALSWCESHQDESSAFLSKLKSQLNTCFVNTTKLSTRKEKMWELFFKLRTSSYFEYMWKEFLTGCGTDASPTVYQHVTDTVFKDMISMQFPVVAQMEGSTHHEVQLDYKEKNALRYVGGYVTRALYQKLQKSKHLMKKELCACLTEMNDVDPDEMHDESDDWMNTIDRGSLKHITNMVYMLFVSVELVLRKHLQGDQPSLTTVKEKAIEDEDVQFYWSVISSNWEEESATVLLEMIIDMWIKIRGHSTARAWLEQYKLNQKTSIQKSKGIRKQLISSAPT